MVRRLEVENRIVRDLIFIMEKRLSTPSARDIRTRAGLLAESYGFDGNLDSLIKKAEAAITTTMESGVSLIQPNSQHDTDWVHRRTEGISWIYTDAYFKYLDSCEWSDRMCQSLRDESETILGLLQDPISGGTWDRRGLVIGSVQSGKTANYLALIARAADAGYKIIIVIAGMQNALRSQTQRRIDEGFVGKHSETNKPIGVGKVATQFRNPFTLTTVSDDFNRQIARQSRYKLSDIGVPIILVIKKNVSVLDCLYGWLKDLNALEADQIETIPMLLIDDEADHASINTNDPDLDPTRTNQLIRKILSLFAKSSFVGYTATPFANIFIRPKDDDLFPRDFIHCLYPPSNYFGPEKVFLEENLHSQFTVPITDCEDVLPRIHKKDHEVNELPTSLCKAIDEFIVARAIHNLRGHGAYHCSMMINVSTFVAVQKTIRELVGIYVRNLKAAVSANYKMPDSISLQNTYMKNLGKAYKETYPDCGSSWEEVKSVLHAAATSVRLFLINSKSGEKLDYRKFESGSGGLTAIAIGGLSLSRGLTLEGLCISYIYRNTRMYDTLMQMGRWFGYRTGYEDLCRIYLSEDAISWYSYISKASLELVDQIREMRLRDKTPKDFGLYVRSHPDRLLVTSPGKMQAGEEFHLRQNFGGRLQQFAILPLKSSVNSRNEKLIIDTWGKENLQDAERPGTRTRKGWIVRRVPIERVENFLRQFITHKILDYKKDGIIKYLGAKSDLYKTCDVILVSIGKDRRQPLHLGVQERASKDEIKDGTWVIGKLQVGSPGDEGLGLSEEQVLEAQKLAESSRHIDIHCRKIRKCPLLMIHVLTGKPGSTLENKRIPTICMSFPPDDYTTEVVVVANSIYVHQELLAVHGEEELDIEMEED